MNRKNNTEPMKLSESEMRQYDEAGWTMQRMNLELNLIHMEQKLHTSEKEKADLKIKLATKEAGEKGRKIQEFKKSHSKFNNTICKRLGFEEGTRFAYDPLTGEVEPINKGDS